MAAVVAAVVEPAAAVTLKAVALRNLLREAPLPLLSLIFVVAVEASASGILPRHIPSGGKLHHQQQHLTSAPEV